MFRARWVGQIIVCLVFQVLENVVFTECTLSLCSILSLNFINSGSVFLIFTFSEQIKHRLLIIRLDQLLISASVVNWLSFRFNYLWIAHLRKALCPKRHQRRKCWLCYFKYVRYRLFDSSFKTFYQGTLYSWLVYHQISEKSSQGFVMLMKLHLNANFIVIAIMEFTKLWRFANSMLSAFLSSLITFIFI